MLFEIKDDFLLVSSHSNTVMEQLTAKFLIEGKVYRPPYRYREIPSQRSARHKQRLSQESDGEDWRSAKQHEISLKSETVVDVSIVNSSLFSVRGRELSAAETHPVTSEHGLFDFMDDDDIEDDVFLPEASPPESYDESLQIILETFRYETGGSIRTLLGFLRTTLCCSL